MSAVKVKLGSKELIILLPITFTLAITLTIPLFWVAFWFMLSWFLISSAWILYTARKINLHFEIDPDVAVRNSYINLKITLLNKSILPLPMGEIYIAEGKSQEKPAYYLYHINSRINKLWINDNTFSPREQKNIQVECFRRGRHTIGPIKIRLYSPLGSIILEKEFFTRKEFVVQPRLLPFSSNFSPGENMFQKKKTPFTPLDYTEMYDLRLFVQGDPPKLINWKVSAKQGDLYVKRVENTGETDLIVCLELSPHFYSSTLNKDLVLEKTLSLVGHLLMKGFKVGFLCNAKRGYLPPGTGKKQLSLIRRFFTELNSESNGELTEQLPRFPSIARAEVILWVVPNLSANYLQNLKNLKSNGQIFTLFFTDDHLYYKDSLPTVFTPLQLTCENNKVRVRQVKLS